MRPRDTTTGFGKRTYARRLTVDFANYMTQELKQPATEATVLGSTTLEDISQVEIRRGWIIVLDEFAIADTSVVQYMNEAMLKTLCDLQSTAGLRARSQNVRFCADTARIIIYNARSIREWASSYRC